MKWATRPGIHIDRAASAWLITRFVDPDAEFVFVEDLDDVPNDATPFDYVGCEVSHRGDDVTFETILRMHDLDDPVLWEIGKIVHEADVEDGRFDAPEAPGFDLIIRAFGADHDDDEVRHFSGMLFDSLVVHLRSN